MDWGGLALHVTDILRDFDSTLQTINNKVLDDHAHFGFPPLGKRSLSGLGISTWNPVGEGTKSWFYFVMAFEEVYEMLSLCHLLLSQACMSHSVALIIPLFINEDKICIIRFLWTLEIGCIKCLEQVITEETAVSAVKVEAGVAGAPNHTPREGPLSTAGWYLAGTWDSKVFILESSPW